MAYTTLRPNGTTTDDSLEIVGGAGTVHGVLSDNSDSSYIGLSSGAGANMVLVTLGDITVPAGSIVRSVRVRLRTRLYDLNPSANVSVGLNIAGETHTGEQTVTWTTPTTTNIMVETETWEDADIDAATLTIEHAGGSGSYRILEAYVDVNVIAQPTVGVGQPTGTVTDETSPAVVWLHDYDELGGIIDKAEVKIFTDAQYGAGGFDPDTSDSTSESGTLIRAEFNGTTVAGSWNIPVALADDTYRAYVRVGQTTEGEIHWSEWDFEQFEMAVIRPSAPTITLTPEDTEGRILIELEEGADPRTNIVTNPKAGTDLTGWTNTSLTTWERVTSLPSGGPAGVTTGFHAIGNAANDRAAIPLTTVVGVTYRASFYLRVHSLSATSVDMVAMNGVTPINSVSVTTVGSTLNRYSFTFTAPVTNPNLWVFQNGAGAMEITFTAVLVEVDTGSLEAYFDGDSDNAAWNGTEEASTSYTGVSTDLFYLQRSDDGGGSWVPVRTGHSSGEPFLTPTAGEASVYDYEMPNGTSVFYQASAVHVYSFEDFANSADVTDSATWEDDAVWLKDPANPLLNVRIP